jgi:hypothetical protein
MGDVGMAMSKQAYDMLPMEEARALIQDWDRLSAEEKARYMALGISKTASTIAVARGLQQLGTQGVNAVRARMAARAAPAVEVSATEVPANEAPYSGRRPTLRKSTVKNNWDKAPEGTAPNSKACSTCGNDVFGNPKTGELRNTPKGWDVDHVRKWEVIRRELQARGASPAEYRNAYNDLNNTVLRCRACNRADNKLK